MFAPPLTGGALLHLDGQCFHGVEGTLAVALSETALLGLLRTRRPDAWVLPLEAPWLAEHLAGLEGEVLWVSARPPREVIGALNEAIRGAWLNVTHVVIALDSSPRHLRLQRMPGSAFVSAYLARLLVNEWTGEGASACAMDPATFPLPASYDFAA